MLPNVSHRELIMQCQPLGSSGLRIPRVVFGTSCLGNLYEIYPDDTKLALARQWFGFGSHAPLIDTAGKYGAGLALETIGRALRELGVSPDRILISNKLGWKRVPLNTPEPTFEPGVWAGIEHDAVQCISYRGILECWEQGCELLGAPYRAKLLSVHDPDDYLSSATSALERDRRLDDIRGAYQALAELKQRGEAVAIGVGAKDWRVIQEIDAPVQLDWVMLANSLTILRHPPELIDFIRSLHARGIAVVNSAVFHAGFLVGGRYFDYRPVDPQIAADGPLFDWRERFFKLCQTHRVTPAAACIQFALSPPGVAAIAVNTSRPERIAEDVANAHAPIPSAFWQAAKSIGLITPEYPSSWLLQRLIVEPQRGDIVPAS
ncbi:MAG: aldo/keto reductase [Pirellulales bacterium]|nr:aldo/keto reductase [Pirellulales bacterium]